MRIAVHSEVGQDSLVGSGLGFPNVGHLDGFLPELPLVPIVVGVQILLNKMSGSLNRLVKHEPIVEASFYCLVNQTELHLSYRPVTFLKVSSSLRNRISSGFLLHCWITPVM